MAERLGGAEIAEIAGGGHDLGVEQPERVADAVLDFLGRVTSRSDGAGRTEP